jgi:hypothetical protein
VTSYYFKLFSTNFGSIQMFCTIRLADHRKKPGTAIQCKTKDSSCHRQSSVQVLSGIRSAQSSTLGFMQILDFFRSITEIVIQIV